MAAGALASCYGVLQYFGVELVWPRLLNPYGNRSVSTFGNPNFISSYLVMLLPFALAYLMSAEKTAHRLLYGFIFLSYAAMLMASLTRSSWGGAAAALLTVAWQPGSIRPVIGASGAVFGLLGRYSFGYFNPALTLALALWRRIDWVRASLSIFFQLLGSALAALLLLHAYPDAAGEPLHLGAPSLGAIGFRTATLVECVLSFFFALAVTRSTVEQGHPSFRTRAVFIGAVAAAAALCAGPLTGAVINPARAFGPALASGFWTHQYVFWIGSLAGSLAGVSLTQTLYKSHQEKT